MTEYQELWFRAEDASHRRTRLQPGLFRPPEQGELRKSTQELLAIESDLYEEFGRCAAQLSPADVGLIDDEWNSYFLMQHHGAPTRLLDWSDGALISLFFAVRKRHTAHKSDTTIYILNPYWLIKLLKKHKDRKDAKKRWKKYWRMERPFDTDERDFDRLYLPLGKDNPKQPLLNMPEVPILWDPPLGTRRMAAQREHVPRVVESGGRRLG
jgi:hypothetical protein